jgi:DNA polymerase alpha-associated DNA helicase A
MAPTSISAFATKQLELLEAERTAEATASTDLLASHSANALQRAGLAITNLTLAGTRTGPGGKTIVELEPDSATAVKGKGTASGKGNVSGNVIPAHGVRVGDIVRVAEMPSGSAKKKEKSDKEAAGADGVVCRVQEARIGVVLEKEEDEVVSGKRLWM